MITRTISQMEECAKHRADGFIQDVLAVAIRDGDKLSFTLEQFSELRKKWNPTPNEKGCIDPVTKQLRPESECTKRATNTIHPPNGGK